MSASEEFFDVVDAEDRVLDQRPRSVVHQQKLLHRATHMFVFRSTGELLIHKRSPNKEEFPSVWTSSASGHVSAGEDYDTSAVRELQEELGIVSQLTRLQKFAACADTSWEFTVLYRTTYDGEVQFDREEMTEIRWLHPTAIARWLQSAPEEFSPAFRLLFTSVIGEE